MAILEFTLEIDSPIQLVYRVSQDYAVRYEWDPFPEDIRVVKGSDEPAPGTQVLVKSKLGASMLVEFVQVQPPSRAAVVMIRGPWYLSKFAGSWIFRERSPLRTEARFRYTITARPWLLRWFMEPLATLYFSRVIKQRLRGLKRYCEGLA